MTREIALTQGYVAIVDDEDYEALVQFKWHVLEGKGMAYACRKTSAYGVTIFMHHEVFGSRQRLDHKDGNGLNNQKSNLRTCTQAQNITSAHRGYGKSRYKGVYYSPKKKKKDTVWCAEIGSTYLGTFSREEDAARAYDRAARERYKDFAVTNFSDESS